jgi:KaiC/GvpD/RAD55 family RecA-like ATPase
MTPRTMASILAHPPPEAPTLLEPALIVTGGITVVAAPTKVGKTNLWLHVAWALTEGKALFGRFDVTRPTSVLMIQLELSEATMHKRLEILCDELAWSTAAQERFHLWSGRALLIDRRDGPKKILDIIEALPERPDVVILDSYNAAVAGDPDKSAEARRALHALRTVQEATGVAWCVTAEIRKMPSTGRARLELDDLKGSNELAYDSDAVVLLRPSSDDRRRLRLSFAAMRHSIEDPPDGLVLVRRGLTFELTEGPGDDREEAVLEVLRDHFERGGDKSWRGCVAAVRESGLRVRDQYVGKVRKQLIATEEG